MKYLFLMILALMTQKSVAFEFPQASEFWLRAAHPQAKMLAAYVTVENQTKQDLKLVGAFSPDFNMTEIHKTIEVDGMLKMREQSELALPQQSKVVMKPGGLHIMLMMPKKRFVVGDMTRICLIYIDEKGVEHVQHLDFPVIKQ